jgi:hypothetical protein
LNQNQGDEAGKVLIDIEDQGAKGRLCNALERREGRYYFANAYAVSREKSH